MFIGDDGTDGSPGIKGRDGRPGPKGKELAQVLHSLFSSPSKHSRGMHVVLSPPFHRTCLGDPGKDGTDGVPGVDGTDGSPGVDGADGSPGPKGKRLARQSAPIIQPIL